MTPAHRPTPAFRLVAIGCGAFILLTFAAMLLFPGGTQIDPTTRGYRFFENFFSDMGGTRSPSGEPNLPSMILFAAGLTVAGVSVATFFILFRRMVSHRPLTRWLGSAAGVCGILSGIGFIGVAVTPWNLVLSAHGFCVNIAFRLLLLAVALDTVALWKDRYAPRACVYIFLAFGVLLVGYIALLAYGLRLGNISGAAIQIAGQKIIIYTSIAAIGTQTLIADHVIRREPHV